MIAGLETITTGTCKIADRVVNEVEPAERDIAMVFQNYALYPHMSVYDNMAYGLRNRRTPKDEIERRVREAAKMLAIEEYLDRRPRALSGGQRQRVAMGRAIVREPQAFLFDEPLSNLDAKLRLQMRIEIRRLHNRLKATSIFVTHDQVEAMTLADVVVVMNQGRIEQIGPPTEVYNRPATKFVATFIGSPAMNLVPGPRHRARQGRGRGRGNARLRSRRVHRCRRHEGRGRRAARGHDGRAGGHERRHRSDAGIHRGTRAESPRAWSCGEGAAGALGAVVGARDREWPDHVGYPRGSRPRLRHERRGGRCGAEILSAGGAAARQLEMPPASVGTSNGRKP